MLAEPKTRIATLEAFEAFVRLPEHADQRFEWIGGEIIEVPSNPYSSQIALRIARKLLNYLDEHPLGHVTGEAGGYRVAGERYAPDVAYIARARQPELPHEGYNPLPPDLAVEVLSPTDSERSMRIKLSNYLSAGTVVWIIDPAAKQAEVHAPGQPARLIPADGALEGGDLLPGLRIPLAELF